MERQDIGVFDLECLQRDAESLEARYAVEW